MNASMNFLSAAGWSAWNIGRMRSASSAGSVLASHNPQIGPMTALVTSNTHAAGQSSEPAVANNTAPIMKTERLFCSKSFAIMRGFQSP